MTKRVGRGLTIGAGLALAAAATLAFLRAPAAPVDRLVFTEVAATAGSGEPDWRFPRRSRIVVVEPAAAGAEPVVLTPEFAAARAPDVSFDGRRVVFAGQRDPDGPWQIWEIDLGRSKARLRVPSCTRCTDPVYRADDGIVFAAPARDADSSLALYTVAPGQAEPERITFHPASDAALGLLSDGRVIVAVAESADAPATEYWAMRHNGTGAELMYRSPAGSTLPGRVHERGRELVFVERPASGSPRVVSISEAYPSSSRSEILPAAGAIRSVFPAPDGSLLAALRPDDSAAYEVWRLGRDGSPGKRVAVAEAGYQAVEPVLATPRPRPLGFVSALDPAAATGTFFGLNARLTGHGAVDSAAATLRVRTPDGDLGDVPLAEDGSFHVQLPSNTPLRLETVDREGRVVDGPSAWIWARPGELSGCVGCHEDRGLVPENRVPMAAILPATPLVAGADDAPGGHGEGR